MKEVLFTIHIYCSAQLEDESELQKVGCRVSFDNANVGVGTVEMETNSVANIDEDGNASRYRSDAQYSLN